MNPFNWLKSNFQALPDKTYLDNVKREILQEIHDVRRAPELAQNILNRTEMGVSRSKCCNEELIVTLSTYGDRIFRVGLTIESLFEQTVKPNRVILNLGRQFDGKEKVPGSLKLLERRGLEIRFTRDIGPYTKLIPTLRVHNRTRCR